jgi:rod shape-determining protein MreD
MNHELIRLPLLFVILSVLQVFVFNHFQLFGCAMPMLYVFFVLTMKKGMAKWAKMVWAFTLGLLLDTFSNTPGVTAAALTLAALAQPYILDLFMIREAEDDIIPSMSSIGVKPFVNYTITLVTVFCITYYTLEMFSFFNMQQWLKCVIGSIILTVALILAIDTLKRKKS